MIQLKKRAVRGNPVPAFFVNTRGLGLEAHTKHGKAQKHKGDEYETDWEANDGCCVRIGLIVGDVS